MRPLIGATAAALLLSTPTLVGLVQSGAAQAASSCVSRAEVTRVTIGTSAHGVRTAFGGTRPYATGAAGPGLRYAVYRSCHKHKSVLLYLRHHRVSQEPAIVPNSMLDL